MKNNIISLLNSLKNVAFEQWSKHGINLKAVSANADGMVDSGILKDGTYFFLKHEFVDGAFTGKSEFVLG